MSSLFCTCMGTIYLRLYVLTDVATYFALKSWEFSLKSGNPGWSDCFLLIECVNGAWRIVRVNGVYTWFPDERL